MPDLFATVCADTRVTGVATAKHWKRQPRHPIGVPEGGQWSDRPVPLRLDGVELKACLGFRDANKGVSTEPVRMDRWVPILKFDEIRGIVEGVVYEPNVLDSQGEFMAAEDLELLAHRFMQLDLSHAMDTKHTMEANGCYPVESFIARDGDPDYAAGAWVIKAQLTPELAAEVVSGAINGFSFAAMVKHNTVDIEYTSVRDHFGITEKTSDHEHAFFAQADDMGRIVKGWTDEVDGHTHEILRASVTQVASDHTHRFFV